MNTLKPMDNLPQTFTLNRYVFTKYYDSTDLFRPFYSNDLGISASYNQQNNSLTFYDHKNRSKKLYSLAFSTTEPHFKTEERQGSTFYKLADSDNLFINPATLDKLNKDTNTIEPAPQPHNKIVRFVRRL